jgi:hypothetical protein
MSELLVLLALVILVTLLFNVVQKTFSLLGLAAIGLLLAGLFRWFTSGTAVPSDLLSRVGLSTGKPSPTPTVVASPTPTLIPAASPLTTATTAQPMTTATPGGYRVACPAGFSVLNVRTAPGLTDRVATIPCSAAGVAITGAGADRDGETWVPIAYQQSQGWVVRRFLTP